jgi:hypothetical protein
MSLTPIDDVRALAGSHTADAFAEALGGPVLLHRHRLEGDLHFADPNARAGKQRAGSTLLHVPRATARARLTMPLRPGRAPVERERLFVLIGHQPRIVGRGTTADLVLRDHSVSADHARLHPVQGTDWCFVVDLGSRNGTVHNDHRLLQGERAELISGDEVTFGREVFVYLHAHDLYRYLTGTL